VRIGASLPGKPPARRKRLRQRAARPPAPEKPPARLLAPLAPLRACWPRSELRVMLAPVHGQRSTPHRAGRGYPPAGGSQSPFRGRTVAAPGLRRYLRTVM